MAYGTTYEDPADSLTQRNLPMFARAQQTEAMNPFQQQDGAEDVLTDPMKSKALYSQARQSIVSQYPFLDGNPQFESEFSDSFSKFVNDSLQRGNDTREVWSSTVAPTLAKWQAAAAIRTKSQIGALESAGLQKLKSDGAAAALAAYPQLLNGPNKQFWMQQDVKKQADSKIDPITQKKISAYEDAMAQAIKDKDVSAAADAESRARSMSASVRPAASALTSTTNLPDVEGLNSEPAAVNPYPEHLAIASPQGTSGYVQYDKAGKAIVSPWSMTLGDKTTTGGMPPRTAQNPAAADLTGEGIESAAKTGSKTKEVVRMTKDGRRAIFDADTKQFIRYATD